MQMRRFFGYFSYRGRDVFMKILDVESLLASFVSFDIVFYLANMLYKTLPGFTS